MGTFPNAGSDLWVHAFDKWNLRSCSIRRKGKSRPRRKPLGNYVQKLAKAATGFHDRATVISDERFISLEKEQMVCHDLCHTLNGTLHSIYHGICLLHTLASITNDQAGKEIQIQLAKAKQAMELVDKMLTPEVSADA